MRCAQLKTRVYWVRTGKSSGSFAPNQSGEKNVRNRVSATLSAAEQQALLEAIAHIRRSLPFLIDLSPAERHDLPKMGDKSRAFVRQAAELAQQNPDLLPRSFDIDELGRDVDLYDALEPLALALRQLLELVDDTMVAVSSEAYSGALTVYHYAKVSGHAAALDKVTDELSRRFARKARPPQ
jgi:hypothetical protein